MYPKHHLYLHVISVQNSFLYFPSYNTDRTSIKTCGLFYVIIPFYLYIFGTLRIIYIIIWIFVSYVNGIPPGFTQFLQGPCRIRRTGRRQHRGFLSCKRQLVLPVQFSRFIPIGIDSLDLRFRQHVSDIRRFHIPDTAVTGAFDVAALDDIPEGNVMCKEHCLFLFYRLRHRFPAQIRHHFPKTVLLMSIIKMVFSGFHRGQCPQDQHLGICIIHRCKGVLNMFIFHILSLLLSVVLQSPPDTPGKVIHILLIFAHFLAGSIGDLRHIHAVAGCRLHDDI